MCVCVCFYGGCALFQYSHHWKSFVAVWLNRIGKVLHCCINFQNNKWINKAVILLLSIFSSYQFFFLLLNGYTTKWALMIFIKNVISKTNNAENEKLSSKMNYFDIEPIPYAFHIYQPIAKTPSENGKKRKTKCFIEYSFNKLLSNRWKSFCNKKKICFELSWSKSSFNVHNYI